MLCRAGDTDEALRTIDDALEEAAVNGAGLWDAELHRIRVLSLTRRGAPAAGIDTALARAREIATAQQATLFLHRLPDSR